MSNPSRTGYTPLTTTGASWTPTRSDADGVEQPVRAMEKRHRMPRRRRVEDDQFGCGRAEPFDLFDLSQHQDVFDAGNGRGDDLDRTGLDQPSRDSPHAVLVEV